MSHSFEFYLYSQNDNKYFVFWNDNEAIISRIASMVDLVPKIVGGNITALLQKNDELMNVLHQLFDEFIGAYPRLKRIFAYLDKLDQNEKFFYVSSDAPLINHLTCIAQLGCIDDSNERKEVHDYILATWGFVSAKYESYGFGFNGIRKCIGVTKDRVCRFCGKQEGKSHSTRLHMLFPKPWVINYFTVMRNVTIVMKIWQQSRIILLPTLI